MTAADPLPITSLTKEDLFASLPPPWPTNPLPAIIEALAVARKKIVVLDDDPTGTQTVHDTPILTEWSIEALTHELMSPYQVFYLLTNSRSLPSKDAEALNMEIARNLQEASRLTDRSFVVISRSDSTLRGHYPVETDALARALSLQSATLLLIPFFEGGGRFTIKNEHYLEQANLLVPTAQTAFARDATFGYHTSNLCRWVEEKTHGHIAAERVASISIEEIRLGGPESVCRRLLNLAGSPVCVVNAATQRDVEVFVLGVLAAEKQGINFLYRSAASFVAARSGMSPRPLLDSRDLLLPNSGPELIIVGSHVPQSSKQLEYLQMTAGNHAIIEIQAPLLLNETARSYEIERVKNLLDKELRAGHRILLYTSRTLLQSQDAVESLAISRRISDALVKIVQSISVRPRYVIVKGGITSSDIATQGFGVKRALVRGQLLPGVPVWELGSETRYPNLIYVVFPGNVGEPNAIAEAVLKLERSRYEPLGDRLKSETR